MAEWLRGLPLEGTVEAEGPSQGRPVASHTTPPLSGGGFVFGRVMRNPIMSLNQVDLSSDHLDAPNYSRDTPTNQEFVAESQTATLAETALQEGIASACEAIHANAASLTRKKKKRTLVKGANLPASSDAVPKGKAANPKGKEKQEILLAAKETAPPNTVPLASMRGKRPITFKKKVLKKEDSSLRPFSTTELPPHPSTSSNQPQHSSPTVVEPSPSSFSPPNEGIPPPQFLEYDPLMVAGFFTPDFLAPPYTLPRGQQIWEGTPFKSNLQSFHAVRPLLLKGLCKGYSHSSDPLEVYGDMCRHLIQMANTGFKLARRADSLEAENKAFKTQAPSEETT
ncbi:hypothetical protein LIER_03196 [Lithospermum erythrorhizon]|uniref:Uncharacterized protein n=1 Tax=Lithospermum erythrorhizon TaxID=34254 RepID=A0AAV3NTG4_LITER